VYGLAAAVSTALSARLWTSVSPRRMWTRAQLVMAAGVLAPAIRTTVPTLLLSAVLVGGTFMVVTMAGMQEARRIAGSASAARLMAGMTAAFALGQLAGPFTVSLLPSAATSALALPLALAAAVLALGALTLAAPSPEPGAPALREERNVR
jgi:hypothetical protein